MADKIAMSTQDAGVPAMYGKEEKGVPSVTTAAGRYNELMADRSGPLLRARQAAAVTVPSLFPQEGITEATTLETPWQAVGAEGVLSLSAKLMLASFPPGQPFFKQQLSNTVVEQLRKQFPTDGPDGSQQFTDAKTALEGALAKQDQAVMDDLEAAAFRSPMTEGFKQLIVAGNMLLQSDDDGALSVHRLDSYVVCRDGKGGVIDFVLRECVDARALPPAAKAIYDATPGQDGTQKRECHLYTWVQRDTIRPKMYRVHQEISGQVIPGTVGTWPKDRMGMWPVAINRIPGQSYGRGHVEMYLGDIISHDSLSQSVTQGLAALVRTIVLVDEAGQTSIKQLSEANNGDHIPGKEEDVHVLQSQKSVDLQVASAMLEKIEKRLDSAFLNASSIQRDAERVTAEEIRVLAQELENNFGGMYSLITTEVQKPLAARRIFVMQRSGDIPSLPKNSVKTVVVSGFAALGRSSDFQKLQQVFVSGNAMLPANSPLAPYTNVGDLLLRLCTAGGVDAVGLFKTEKEVAQAAQEANARDLAGKTGAAFIKTQGDLAMHSTPPAQPQGAAS